MKTTRLKCGCRYELSERERWLELCTGHETEWQALHRRATAERVATMAAFDTMTRRTVTVKITRPA